MKFRLFERFYAPFLFNEWVRPSVVVVFFGWLCASIAMVPKIDVGLDQVLFTLNSFEN